MTDGLERVRRHLAGSADVKRQTAALCGPTVVAVAHVLAETFRRGGKLLICGNGGSAADCQHMAAEFVSRLHKARNRRALPALALTTDTSFLTAFANDCGFDEVFSRQVEAFGQAGDVLVGISTSGNSENVLRAVETARKLGLVTVALTGTAGRLAGLVDAAIAVPSGDTQHVQETHLALEHVICDLVEHELFGPVDTDPRAP